MEAVGIDRDRAAVAVRLDHQDQLAFLKPGEAEQLAAEPKLRRAMVGLFEAYDSNLDLTHVRALRGTVTDLARARPHERQS